MPSAAFSKRERIRFPDELVERHAALSGRPLDHGPRAEDGVGLLVQQRGQDLGERFGCVLAIAVEHHDDVEAVLDGQLVAGLLVAAVAEVGRLPDQRDRKVRLLLVAQARPGRSSPGCGRR